ncbi:hypothetical protein [Nesterenkonia alba]|uniref:hypothetical protein n=1 Tax=Nesterenkonia alba TaxID=515814 RepID=UPI0003B6096A|nr:hypothetical protein [Nesterenkonia alba]
MTTTTQHSSARTEDKGLAGVWARLREGRKHGYGIFHPGSWFMLIGGMMLIFATFLPWIHFGGLLTFRGLDGPGLLTISVGFLAFAGGFVPKRKLALLHAAIPGVLVAALCLWQIIAGIIIPSVRVEWGVLLPGMGLVLAAGGAVLLLKATHTMWTRWPAS